MFIKNALSFGSANFLGQIFRAIQELWIRSILSPTVLGTWNYVTVTYNLSSTFDAGVQTAVVRELSLLHSSSDASAKISYQVTSFWMEVIQRAVIAMGFILYGLSLPYDLHQVEVYSWLAAGGFVILGGWGETFSSFYRANQDYTRLSVRTVFYWAFFAAVHVLAAKLAGVKGLLIAFPLSLSFYGLILSGGMSQTAMALLKPRKYFRWSMAKSLLAFGVPFRITEVPMVLFQLADVLFLSRMSTLETLATYSTAKLVVTQVGQIMAWFSTVMNTRIAALFVTKSKKSLGEDVAELLEFYYLLFIPATIVGSLVAMIIVVRFIIPQYERSLEALPVLLFSLYFLPNTTVIRNFLILEKKFRPLLIGNLIGLASVVLGYFIVSRIDLSNQKIVSLVSVLSFAFYFLFICWQITKDYFLPKTLGRLLLFLAFSLGSTGAAIYFSGLYSFERLLLSMPLLLGAALKGILILIPCFCVGLWRTDILSRLKKMRVSVPV